MNDVFQLKTQYFAGPIEKLLSLIEARELDVSVLSLAEVTADFLAYVATLKNITPAILADFIVVASRLIHIKSKALLPDLVMSAEEETDLRDLELRVHLYKQCQLAARSISSLWGQNVIVHARELLMGGQTNVFYPSQNLKVTTLEQSLRRMLHLITQWQLRENRIVRSALISVEQKMTELMNELTLSSSSRFSALAKNNSEMIALFLAILHLFKDGAIKIEQQEIFSDMMISGVEARK